MNKKFQDILYRLKKIDITADHISLDFVGFHDFQNGLIPPFVDILVNIFNDFDRGANLHLNIDFISTGEIKVVKDDSSIIVHPTFPLCHLSTIHHPAATVFRVIILADYGFLVEILKKAFGTRKWSILIILFHADGVRLERSTETVDHNLLYNLGQGAVRIQPSIRKFGTNDIVNLIRLRKSVTTIQKDDDMRMR